MKLSTIAVFAMIISAAAAAITHDWNPVDDEKLVQAVAAAALHQDNSNIHRVTRIDVQNG